MTNVTKIVLAFLPTKAHNKGMTTITTPQPVVLKHVFDIRPGDVLESGDVVTNLSAFGREQRVVTLNGSKRGCWLNDNLVWVRG